MSFLLSWTQDWKVSQTLGHKQPQSLILPKHQKCRDLAATTASWLHPWLHPWLYCLSLSPLCDCQRQEKSQASLRLAAEKVGSEGKWKSKSKEKEKKSTQKHKMQIKPHDSCRLKRVGSTMEHPRICTAPLGSGCSQPACPPERESEFLEL